MKRTMKEQRGYIRAIMLCLTAFICICMSGMKVNAKVRQNSDYRYFIVSDQDKNETVIIDKYIGNDSKVRIPSYIDGKKVSIIQQQAFTNCNSVHSVYIDEGIEQLNYTFVNCDNLEYVSLPSSIKDIRGAFVSCKNIKKIDIPSNNEYYYLDGSAVMTTDKKLVMLCSNFEIPEDTVEIEWYAFQSSGQIQTLVIPKNVKNLSGFQFMGLTNLNKISVDPDNPYYDSRNDCNAIIDSDNNTLILGVGSTVIPENVSSIDNYAFYQRSGLKTIHIPDTVDCIGSHAFSDCTNLISVKFPASLETIESYAFDGCTSLENIVLPDSLQTIGKEAFAYCEKIKIIEIPQNVKTIEDEAFRGCESVDQISVASGNISYDSRNDCNAIINTDTDSLILACKNTVIPSNIKEIWEYAFSNDVPFTNITLPESLEIINKYAFFNCKKLKSIYIPKNVKKIGWDSFGYCDALTRIEVDPDNPIYDSRKDCNAIVETSTNAIVVGCADTIFVPEITAIDTCAFEYNNSITELVLPDTITSIGIQAFSCCNNLKTVTLPKSIECINECMFYNCGKLEEIVVPDSVKTIYDAVFADCISLKSVVIPDSVTSFAAETGFLMTFDNCNKDLIIYANPGSYAEEYCSQLGYTVKPISARDKDNSDDNTGKNDSDNKDSNNGNPGNAEPVDKQPGNPVSNTNNTTTTNATNTAGVQAKGTEVQLTDNNCVVKVSSESTDKPTVDYMKPMQSVANITIPDSVTIDGIVYNVTKVSSDAFAGNKKLKKIVLGKNVTCIEKNAFKNCIKLKMVKCVSTQLNKIGDNAFANCKKLNKIYLSTNKLTAKSIGKNIFKNTSNKLVIKTSKANRKFYKKIFKKKGNNVQIK